MSGLVLGPVLARWQITDDKGVPTCTLKVIQNNLCFNFLWNVASLYLSIYIYIYIYNIHIHKCPRKTSYGLYHLYLYL